ncbi:hypothetical protein [Salinigranum sp. GCM10025319]|uniref:hypothetical protein n=1 Tax=Salinigranum sp. GCM10025319 TaxID=3252687 RepID=UPI00360D5402
MGEVNAQATVEYECGGTDDEDRVSNGRVVTTLVGLPTDDGGGHPQALVTNLYGNDTTIQSWAR